MRDFTNGWYVKYENGDMTNYMSRVQAEKLSDIYNNSHTIDEGNAYLMYDKDFNIEIVEDDLIAYGLFNGDFFVLVKQVNFYILYIIIGAPDCNIANIPGVIDFINECEEEEIKYGHAYKYQGFFDSKVAALEKLSKF